MSFVLNKFRSFGIEADEVLNKYNKQIAVLDITALNTDSNLDIGDFSGTFWSNVNSPESLKAIKDLNAIVDSFIGLHASEFSNYVKVGEGDNSIISLTSAATIGGVAANNFETVSVPGLLSTDEIISIQQMTEGTAKNQVLRINSNGTAGGSATIVYTVPGLLATDTIFAVTPQTFTNLVSIRNISAYSNNSMTVVYTGDPGGASILVWVLRTGGNSVVSHDAPTNNSIKAYWQTNPGSGAVLNVSVIRFASGGSSPQAGAYAVEFNSPNQIPIIGFKSGDAPTSYSLVLEWTLKDNNLPVFYEST